MRTLICTLLLTASVAGYSQQILVGLGYDDVIEYLEENDYEWITETDLAQSGEEVLIIYGNHYFGETQYIFYKDSDICWLEQRYFYGISKASLINHLDAKYEDFLDLVWADYSDFGYSDNLMLIHEIVEWEDEQFSWRITSRRIDPVTPKGFLTRSMTRFKYGFYNEAIKDFDSAMKLDNDYPFGEYAEVMKVLVLVGENEAEELFDSLALGIDHGPIDYLIHGLIQSYKGHSYAAIEAYTDALNMNPRLYEAYLYRGDTYSQIGNLKNVVEDFTVYIERFPEAYSIIRQRAHANADLGNYEMAISDLKQVLTAFPEDARSMTNIAKFKSYLGQYSESLELLKKSLQIDPNAPDTYIIKGLVYKWMNADRENALSSFTRAIALDPENYVAHYFRARTYANMQRHFEAIEDCNRAIEINPFSLDSYFFRAHSRSETGDKTGAIDDYREILKYEGTTGENVFLWGTVYNNKGYSLIELGRYEEARPLIDKALELEPEEDYIWGTRGELHYLTGEYENCIDDMDMAIELRKSDVSKAPELGHEVAYYYRGLAKIKLGHIEEGCADLRESKRIGNPDAEAELEQWCYVSTTCGVPITD